MTSQDVQVILAVDPTMQGNDGARENSTIWLPKQSLIDLRSSLWEEGSQGCKLHWAASTHKLACS